MNTAISWKEKNIIRLDDHQIVLDGFTNWCRREHLEITIKNFTDPGKVFLYIVSALTKGEKLIYSLQILPMAGLMVTR